MLSILICHSYYLRLDQKQLERAKPYPPLATLQVAAMLRRAGHRVAFFDAMLAEGPADFIHTLTRVDPQVVLLYEDTFNFLNKMCLGIMRRAACDMIGASRRAGARVFASGPDVSDAPGPYLNAGAEAVLIGEGLATLADLLGRLSERPAVDLAELTAGLKGLHVLEGDGVATHPGARLLETQDHEGMPAWDLVDMERYRRVWLDAHGYFSMNMAASRGCSFRCAWCAKPTWGHHYLQRTAGDVALEMAHLRRSYEPQHIWFADDIFGFRVGWVSEFAESVRAAGGGVRFTIQTRADLISEAMAQALAGADCHEAWIGAESGSQRVLDAMNKGTTVGEILTARGRLQAAGIRVGFFIQLGYLGEEIEDIVATRDLLERSRPDEIGVSVSYPLPGTRFHDLVKAQLGGKTRWRESNDLEVMFHGTYTSGFYRSVRDLLHEHVAQPAPASPEWEQRWQELVRNERRFRSPPRGHAETGH